jgi:hypothetical protein
MPIGHIRLGTPGDLRPYLLVDERQYNRATSNPFAAQVSTAGAYSTLEGWGEWLMQEWQPGIGFKDPEEGMLYSELDSRFSRQLILPPRFWFHHTWADGTEPDLVSLPRFSGMLSLTGSYQKVASKLTIGSSNLSTDALFLWLGGAGTVDVSFYKDNGGNPDAGDGGYVTSIALSGKPGINPYYVNLSYALDMNSSYWIVLSSANGGQVPYGALGDALDTATGIRAYNGSTWSAYNTSIKTYFAVHLTLFPAFGTIEAKAIREHVVPSSSTRTIYFLFNHTGYNLFYWIQGSGEDGNISWVNAGQGSANAVDMLEFGNALYIANGAATDMHKYVGGTNTWSTLTGVKAEVLAAWNGYLWRSVDNDVYYTANGSTWTGPIQIGPDGYKVTGMAGMGTRMYISTDEALYYVGESDIVWGVTRWGSVDANNGKGMIHHQGSIYVPVVQELFRIDEDHTILPMGLNKKEGLPANRQGRIVGMKSHNYWLFVVLSPTNTATQWGSMWAWDGTGWHFMFLYPLSAPGRCVGWDSVNNNLWTSSLSFPTRFPLPTNNENPARDNSGKQLFWSQGGMETDWFYGGVRELQKDWESVYISGENITATRTVKVYWQDDESTDWEFLGTVTANQQELRWNTPSTRPNSRQIKLLLLLGADSKTVTPIVNAVRVKYLPMINDRWRWQLPIAVHDSQQMTDGSLNLQNSRQMQAHLASLVQSVAPVILEDMDGTQYEVKVLSCSVNVEEMDNYDGEFQIKWVYGLSLEQVTSGAYSA